MKHLTIDAGNSQLALVVYSGKERLGALRIRSKPRPSVDAIKTACEQILGEYDWQAEDVILTISSVVPELENALKQAAVQIKPSKFHWVDWESPHGFTASASASKEIGADLISGLVGAREFATTPMVVVDCGTATTLTLADENDHILGVAILPGLVTQMLSLTHHAPHLPQEVCLRPPAEAWGNDTEEALQSGILYGHAGSIEGILARYRGKFPNTKVTALACGGLFHRISTLCPSIDVEKLELVNIGCRILGEKIAEL